MRWPAAAAHAQYQASPIDPGPCAHSDAGGRLSPVDRLVAAVVLSCPGRLRVSDVTKSAGFILRRPRKRPTRKWIYFRPPRFRLSQRRRKTSRIQFAFWGGIASNFSPRRMRSIDAAYSYRRCTFMSSGVTMGWLLRLVTRGPTGCRGPDSCRVLSD